MTPQPLPPVAPPAPRNKYVPLFVALGGLALTCFCCIPGAIGAYLGSLPESGVLSGNQVDERSRAHIAKHVRLEPDEEIICYFDGTISVDGTNGSLLTTKRLVTWTGATTTEMKNDEMVKVSAREDPLQGDLISVVDARGREMTIVVALFNDGARFKAALDRVIAGGGAEQRADEPVLDEPPPPEHDAPQKRKRR